MIPFVVRKSYPDGHSWSIGFDNAHLKYHYYSTGYPYFHVWHLFVGKRNWVWGR